VATRVKVDDAGVKVYSARLVGWRIYGFLDIYEAQLGQFVLP